MKNKINKQRLTNRVIEEGMKKAIELTIIGCAIGLTLNTLFITIAGTIGGSLYFKDNQNCLAGGQIR